MAFVDDLPADIKSEILRISEENKDAFNVFQKLYNHLTATAAGDDNKRRKLEPSEAAGTEKDYYEIDSIAPTTIIFQLRDLSFQAPLRKKLNLTLSISPFTQTPILSVSKSNELKPDLVIDDLSKENVYFSTFLPVPEKPQLLYLVLFYKQNLNNAFQNDPIVLTLNKEQITKQLLDERLIKPGGDFKIYVQRQAQLSGFRIVESFNTGFNSFFVQAHKGTKEGFLYFLPNHILFGFKKPVLLFPSSDIESISYSSITRVTFNVTLVLKNGEKFEFSMIDQQEFANIDDYIKNRQVQDNSMSEALKAKPLTKNHEQPGALAEASQQLQADGVPIELAGGDDSDDEEDGDFQVGQEVDDTSDVSSGDDDSDDDDDDDDDDEDDEEEDENGDENGEIDLTSD